MAIVNGRYVEEEMAKVPRGITVPLPPAQTAGAGFRQAVGNIITGANETVRNVSPVREIYGLAGGVRDFAQGVFGGQPTAAAPAPAVPANVEEPRTYVPPYTTAPDGTRTITPEALDAVHKRLAEADARKKAAGLPTTAEFNKILMQDFDRAVAGTRPTAQSAASPNLGFRRNVANGETTSTVVDQNTGRTYTDIRTPFINGIQRINPGRPNLTGDPARDRIAIDAFNAEQNAYAQLVGGIPLQRAQAGLTGTQAAELPLTGESARGLQGAQGTLAEANARLINQQAAQGNLLKFNYQEPNPENPIVGSPITGQGFYNPTSGETIYPSRGGLRPQTPASMISSLTPEKKNIVMKYFGDRTDVTPDEVAAYIQTLK